jgi:hypothetical protein
MDKQGRNLQGNGISCELLILDQYDRSVFGGEMLSKGKWPFILNTFLFSNNFRVNSLVLLRVPLLRGRTLG